MTVHLTRFVSAPALPTRLRSCLITTSVTSPDRRCRDLPGRDQPDRPFQKGHESHRLNSVKSTLQSGESRSFKRCGLGNRPPRSHKGADLFLLHLAGSRSLSKEMGFLRQLGVVVFLLVSYLTPAMACMVSDVQMSAEERACCRANEEPMRADGDVGIAWLLPEGSQKCSR